MKYFTDREIHVCGVQRTGQHAIVIWLIGHFNNVCFRNSIPPKYDIRGKVRLVTPPWAYFDIKERDFKWETIKKESYIRPNQDAIIFGTEYIYPRLELNDDIECFKKKMVKKYKVDAFSRRQDYVMVIRSPWNHLASVLGWKTRWYLKKKERFIACWNVAAEEYLGITDVLPKPKTFVNFDKWFAEKKYRKKISKQLGLNFSDDGLNIVMPMGWGKKGSSFDTMKYNGTAQKMPVLDRWKEYENNTVEFTDVLKMDEKLRKLSKKIFGPFPAGL